MNVLYHKSWGKISIFSDCR